MLINPEFLHRIDDADDELFYSQPRFVVHIDDGAIATIGEIFARSLPQRSAVLLDVMSSWRSHLPSAIQPARVVGLGLNRAEMEDNPQLGEVVVHNLNREPRLPFDAVIFDGAMLTVSVQYLTHPIEVFADVGRVLKPGAPFVVSFSNRMFFTKAVALWTQASEPQRVALVQRYFQEAGRFEKMETFERGAAQSPAADPVYAVIGRRRALVDQAG